MPLSKAKNKVNANISKVMHDYSNSGTIGNYRPKNKRKAQKMAVAIALDIERRAKAKKRSS